MRIEPLVATMYQKDTDLRLKMNIDGPCTIINQTDFNKYPNLQVEENNFLFISNQERGLSKSRNAALKATKAEICLVADDDLIYNDNYLTIIEEAYGKYPKADLIIFDFTPKNQGERTYGSLYSSPRKLKKLDALKVSSVRISFRKKSIVDNKIYFNEKFGVGATFHSGEEHLFLKKCFENNLQVYYVPIQLSTVDFKNSGWFKGFDKKYFISKGAFAYAFFKSNYLMYIFYFAITKRNLYKEDYSIFKAIKFMKKGAKIYRKSNKKT